MILFYRAYIESVLTFSLLCWFGNLNTRSKNALSDKVIKTSNKILGVEQCTLTDLFTRQIIREANEILSDSSHPLHSEFQFLPSGPRLSLPCMKSNRYKHSFVPTAISLLNSGQGKRSRTWLVDIGFCFLSPCGVIDVGRIWWYFVWAATDVVQHTVFFTCCNTNCPTGTQIKLKALNLIILHEIVICLAFNIFYMFSTFSCEENILNGI